ncbi:hypothetical protein OG592_42590 (plasmid) [Streptomyces avidinii]|uniref:hypothetical protein n=1 Tax=Streptomyces avidinii TaxID=1895 RepID=UPI002F919CC5|nr:hypothetical protein OG592_42590 [Streptomyces avidinii]
MNTQDGPGDGRDLDVLDAYLETVQDQMSSQRFRTLVTAVQTTGSLLSEGPAASVTVPGDCLLNRLDGENTRAKTPQ